ncbi:MULTISPECIES: SRPBCC family protein [unclassified Nocardioides]|uniref:SRPBCC family protein n=1 Tax=unclassified Nocardioides TaxID=2615069 RepID=UPI0007025489|nr:MULTISPECIES: SRPBCC family protein [unclassified Nocardioides]KRC53438.1 polyketide cyclase [Nocardioides sp. Root79]KRC68086.1 polyketide cyclase [Nocardioides sp. Root240]
MTDTYEKLLEDSIEIAAPAAEVWALVTDLPRMAKWSPQVVKSSVKGGEVKLGATFSNLNKQGIKRWPTAGKVVRYTPPAAGAKGDFAFKIRENRTIWSFELEPTADGGTKLTERRETPQGVSNVSLVLTKVVLGGQKGFTDELRQGIRQTLERIKAEAEA